MSRLCAAASSAIFLVGAAGVAAPAALAVPGPAVPDTVPLVSSPTVLSSTGCTGVVVPERVSALGIEAVGASGSPGFTDIEPNTNGHGAVVRATWPVSPGQTLYVCVNRYGGMGDFSGLGDGGGLASVSLAPWSQTARPAVVAGGGGAGSAAAGPGADDGQGGDAGWPGVPAGDGIPAGTPGPGQGAGGAGATASGPGAGGAADPNEGLLPENFVTDGEAGGSFLAPGDYGSGGQGLNGMVWAPDILRGGGGGGAGLSGGGGGGSSMNGNGGPGGGGMSDCSAPATSCSYALAPGFGRGYVKLTWTVDSVRETETVAPPAAPPPASPAATEPPATPAPSPPAVAPEPAPARTGTPARPAAAPTAATWGVRLTPAGDATPSALPVVTTTKQGVARLALACPATATGCDASGELTIDLPAALARAAARRQTTLARFRGVQIAAGRSHLLRVKLRPPVVKRLRHEGIRRVRATLTIDNHLDGGPSVRTRQRVVIRIPVAPARRAPAAVSPSFTG